MNEWFQLVDRFGVSLSVLVALWIAIRAVAKWLGPRIDDLIGTHKDMVTSIKEDQSAIRSDIGHIRMGIQQLGNCNKTRE